MTDTKDSVELLELYRRNVRDFLAENASGDLTPLDQVAELLEKALNRSEIVSVGFVGESQVGKSTLINALLERRALPSGGIGPLTAQATRVSYADPSSVTVTYHGKKQLNQLVFSIAAYLHRRGEIAKAVPLPDGVDAAEVDSFTDPDEGHADGTPAPVYRSEKGEYMLNQAKRILTHGNPATDGYAPPNVELLLVLRALQGEKRAAKADGIARYQSRIAEVQKLLGSSEELREIELKSAAAFNKALRERATGWRSPLVQRLHVQLATPGLNGMTLVDLPGIGVLNDPAGQEAEKFVREEGDALVVVFRNSGLTENIAALLERTGVITKLLFGGRDNVPPIELTLVVTHMDDVAKEHYRTAREEAMDTGAEAPDRATVFRQVAAEMKTKLREMLADALRKSPAFDGLPDEQRQARERVISVLCERMAVVCGVAPDYLGLLSGNAEDFGFLHSPNDTGIPELRSHLEELVRTSAERRRQAIIQFDTSLREAIRQRLAALVHMYQEGRGMAIQDWERFRDELTKAAEPLRREMNAFHGEVLGALKKGIGAQIDLLCKDAEIAGRQKLQRLSREGREKHYMSLRAALQRDGVWDRRDINYPDAITLAMVDSVASQWDAKVIERVRSEIKTLVERDLKLVEKVCAAARQLGGKLVGDEALETQKGILQGAAKTAVAWTREQLEGLRDAVRQSLRAAVAIPIQRMCEHAIRHEYDRGTGAKNRILSTFEEGGEAGVVEAREAAEKVLKTEYNGLLRKLNDGFLRENHDPVQSVLDLLTGQQVERARRADARRKSAVLAWAEGVEQKLGPAREHSPVSPG